MDIVDRRGICTSPSRRLLPALSSLLKSSAALAFFNWKHAVDDDDDAPGLGNLC